MSKPNRAAPEPKPCKKQLFPFFHPPPQQHSDSSDINTDDKSSDNKSKSNVNIYFQSSSTSNSQHSTHATPPLSRVIKSALKAKNVVPWETNLPETSRSTKTQVKISRFFTSLVEKQNTKPRLSPLQNYLPSQALFHLQSKITKAPIAALPTTRPRSTSSSSSSSLSSDSEEVSRKASPLVYQSEQSSQISSTKKIILQDDFQYSEAESPGHSPSISASDDGGSIYEPSHQTTSAPQKSRRSTRSAHMVHASTNICPSQIRHGDSERKSSSTMKPHKSNVRVPQMTVGDAEFHSIEKYPSDPADHLQSMMTTLSEQMQKYTTLQQEYTARQQYIDSMIDKVEEQSNISKISSLGLTSSETSLQKGISSISKEKPPGMSEAPKQPPKRYSSLPSPSSEEDSTTPSQTFHRIINRESYHHKWTQRYPKSIPFSRLNYAGEPGDPSFNSTGTSSISATSSSSQSRIQYHPIIDLQASDQDTCSIASSFLPLGQPSMEDTASPKSSTASRQPLSQSSSIRDYENTEEIEIRVSSQLSTHSPLPTEIQFSPQRAPSSPVCHEELPSLRGAEAVPEHREPSQTSASINTSSPSQSSKTAVLSISDTGNCAFATPSSSVHENPTIKNAKSIRFIAQNCRGLYHKKENPSDHYVYCMESFKGYSPDVILLSETNTDWKVQDHFYDTKLRNKAIWSPIPTKTLVSSCRWDNPSKTTYQPGGVMSVCLNHMPSRIKTNYRDPYGRYVKIVFQAHQKTIAVYNVYRPNKMSLSSAGVDTAWMQQYRCMRKNNPKVDPRRQCIEDLITEIQKGHENGELPIIFGDFNEDIQLDSGFGIRELQQSCSMVQVYHELHGVIPSSRGNHRSVFHAFTSTHLIPYVDRLGVLDTQEGFHLSDHIPFFVDFKLELFDHVPPIVPPDFRKLRIHDHPRIEEYNCYVKDQFQHHSIVQRIRNLEEYIKVESFNEIAEKELEKLDEQITEIRLRSEDRLLPDPSRYKHATPMDKIVQKIRIVQSILKLRNGKKNADHLIRYGESIDIPPYEVADESNAKKYLKSMKNDLKFMHEEEAITREDHLDCCIEKAIQLHDKKKISIIKDMKEREKQRRSWDKIHFTVKPNRRGGVDRLGIPMGMENSSTLEIWNYLSNQNNKPSWTFITDSIEIERRLEEWQLCHYSQAQETPLATKQWQERLDPVSKTDEQMSSIMEGELFTKSDLPMESKRFLKHMTSKIQPQMKMEDVEITTKKYRSFYKGAKERTSSSPSGLHLGHWKASAFDEDVSSVIASVINIAVQNEHTLRRWQNVVGILLEKIQGTPHIHKFRTIHLVESDFNFVLRSVWGRALMKHGEFHSAWNSNQYGGRKGCQGQSAALNKVLTMDVIRHYGEPAALLDNDAKACYDRLIPVLLSYSLVRLGLPKHLTRFMCKWLQTCKYKLKLAHGVTQHSYGTTLERYLFGTGQGTGWSPPNWASISDIISDAMDENTPGMHLQHPDNITFLVRCFDAFVDDVNGGLTSDGMIMYKPKETGSVPIMETIFEQIEKNVEYYSRLLFTSGGKLALHKCYCYILEFQWKGGKKSMVNTAEKYPPLQVDQTFTGNTEDIILLNPSEGRKMLGTVSAPDGNTKDQEKELYEKAQNWGNKIKSGYLNRYDVSMSLRQGIMKALEYPLGVSLISEDQCKHIMSPILSPFLQKLGINSKTSREIIHGPIQYGGLQVPHLYSSQGIQKVRMLLGHCRKQDKTGCIIKIALGTLQQEVGISTPILENDFDRYKEVASLSWIKRLWEFISKIEGKIHITGTWTPPPCYQNDTNIMELVSSWGLHSTLFHQINLCRLYLRIYYVGEMLDTSKVRLRRNIRNLSDRSYHNDKFPKIPHLPKRFQEVWDTTVTRILQESRTGHHLGNLTSILSFEWRTSQCFQYLFRYEKNRRISTHRRLVSTTNILTFGSTACILNHSEYIQDVFVITATILQIGIIQARSPQKIPMQLRHQSPNFESSPESIPNSLSRFQTTESDKKLFYQKLHSKHPAYQRIIGHISSNLYLRELAVAIQKEKILGVGDASVTELRAGHAYILETIPPRFHIHGVAPVDCVEEDVTSNRAEGCTILAMLHIIEIICNMFDIPNGSITLFCDNKEALRKRNVKMSTYTKLSIRDTDIKMELFNLLASLPISVTLEHVSGHADDDPEFEYDKAPQQVQRNIDMHDAVTAYMQNPPKGYGPKTSTPFFPAQNAALSIRNMIISGDINYHVIMQMHGSKMEQRLQHKLHVPWKYQHIIDWEHFKIAFKKLNPVHRAVTTKTIHSLWPTASILEERQQGRSNVCLRCHLQAETVQHVYQCQSRSSKASYRESIAIFRKKLQKIHTPGPMISIFIEFLVAYHQNRTPKKPKAMFGSKKSNAYLLKAYNHQMLLKSNVFHLGYISYKWGYIHKMHIKNQKEINPETAPFFDSQWSTKVIQALWVFSQSIWKKRCAHVHKKDPELEESLCSAELKSSISSYLRLPRETLSRNEKLLHLNVSRHLKKAFPTTLARWLKLLAEERELTIRAKRSERIAGGGLQPLTKFFRWRAPVSKGN